MPSGSDFNFRHNRMTGSFSSNCQALNFLLEGGDILALHSFGVRMCRLINSCKLCCEADAWMS